MPDVLKKANFKSTITMKSLIHHALTYIVYYVQFQHFE